MREKYTRGSRTQGGYRESGAKLHGDARFALLTSPTRGMDNAAGLGGDFKCAVFG